jgi:DNA-binding NarL/FixJ family response regulator
MQKKRVVLIEDETLFRQLIRLTLGKVPDLEVVAEFGTAREGIAYCADEKPDLLVTDLMLPDLEGRELIRTVRTALPDTRVMLLTGHPGGRLPSELLSLGIEGYLDKGSSVDFLLHAVRTVLDGGMFFASRQSPRAKTVEEARALPELPLTGREQQIARMVAAGKLSKEIARELGLSVRTVEKHRANLMAKIGVREVASLTRWCLQAGLLSA